MPAGKDHELSAAHSGDTPRFSIVSAVHNVHRYLPEFIDSIEKQSFDLSRVEVIAVDDGSTDDSLVMLKEWAARRPNLVRVLTQDNAGQGAARNLGLDHARGEWVTFPDPDDMLDPAYLSTVDTFLRANPTAAMIATARILYYEDTDVVIDKHPLRQMFDGRDQLVDLEAFPDFFHGSAPAAFFRTDVIERAGLRFDTAIRPNFEDGHFCARYLLAGVAPVVGFLGTARYIYRKRADGSSTLQNGLLEASRFTVVPRRGYLDLLTRAPGPDGYAPPWVQNLVLYELSFYFSSDQQLAGGTAAHGEVARQFVELLREIAAKLDPDVIEGFGVRPLDPAWRDILLHGLREDRWVPPYAVLDEPDPRQKLVRLSYRFVGEPPAEQILLKGEPVEVGDGKIWVHEYFDHELLRERVAWVPTDGALSVLLDGKAVRLQPGWPDPVTTIVRPPQLRRWFEPESAQPTRQHQLRRVTKVVRRLGRTWPVRRRYHDAWVLMDRIHDADDNAERLFRYLRTNRPDINAWFVLEQGTPDWQRLVRDGYRARLVAHGGVQWRWLMLNCAHLISSHADAPVHRPAAITRMIEPKWKFTFLQHGVIKDDLSRWLNPKQIDLFVTSTPQEQQSIAGDYTAYGYTSKEAKMTGLPRFDRLLELGARVEPEARTWILVSPTWRYWLTPPHEYDSQRREVHDAFLDSEYARQWTALLSDPRLHAVAEQHNLRIGFLPHPNIQPALDRMTLPPHVQPLTFTGNDVQQLLADTALMITDYSSMAFNAAYLDRPVVYFQFDADQVHAGAHVGRPGYYDYTRDGFGPLTHTLDHTITAATDTITTDRARPAPHYQQRIDTTFPNRDGLCCQRTTTAIEALTAPGPKQTLAHRVARKLIRSPRLRRTAALARRRIPA